MLGTVHKNKYLGISLNSIVGPTARNNHLGVMPALQHKFYNLLDYQIELCKAQIVG